MKADRPFPSLLLLGMLFLSPTLVIIITFNLLLFFFPQIAKTLVYFSIILFILLPAVYFAITLYVLNQLQSKISLGIYRKTFGTNSILQNNTPYDIIDNFYSQFDRIISLWIQLNKQIKDELNKLFKHSRQFQEISENARINITEISESVDSIASGVCKQVENIVNIDTEMNTIEQAMNQVADGAEQQVQSVKTAADSVSSNDMEVFELSQAAERQAEEVINAKSIINQMAENIDAVSADAYSAVFNSNKTKEMAEKGGESVDSMVQGMEDINEAISETSTNMKSLAKSSIMIGEIIEIIDDISEQTNLLALNAAIEAAKAGEHGRGFAVVANAIRNLAVKSSKSTKEIATLIKDIQTKSRISTESMAVATSTAKKGEKLTQETKQAFLNIVEDVNRTVNQIQNISSSSAKLLDSSSEVVEMMDTITSLFEKTNNSILELKNRSTEIVESIINIQRVSQSNKSVSVNIKEKYEQVVEKIKEIMYIADENSTFSEQVSDSVENLSDTINQVNDYVTSMTHTSNHLIESIDLKKII